MPPQAGAPSRIQRRVHDGLRRRGGSAGRRAPLLTGQQGGGGYRQKKVIRGRKRKDALQGRQGPQGK